MATRSTAGASPWTPLSQPNPKFEALPLGTAMTETAPGPVLSWPDCTSSSRFGWNELIHALSSAAVPLSMSSSWLLAPPDCQNVQACHGAGALGGADW